MDRITTDPAAVNALGGRIASSADALDPAVDAVNSCIAIDGPPQTAAAVAAATPALSRSVNHLRDDVVALGRLTEVAGASYERVEAAAAALFVAERGGGNGGR